MKTSMKRLMWIHSVATGFESYNPQEVNLVTKWNNVITLPDLETT